MKLLNLICFSIVGLTVMPQIAHADLMGRESGGGKGVVCRDRNNRIKSAELLDLWEARTLYGRKIVESKKPVAQQVADMLPQLDIALNSAPNAVTDLKIDTQSFLTNEPNPRKTIKRLRGVELTLTDDSFEEAKPENCAVEQIVIYKSWPDHTEILINQDIYEKLDATNQAALISHEALYFYLRFSQLETDSIRTRRTIGYLFAGNKLQTVMSVLPARYIECATGDSVPQGGTTLDFFAGAGDTPLQGVVQETSRAMAIGGFRSKVVAMSASNIDDLNHLLVDNEAFCKGAPDGTNTELDILQTNPITFDHPDGIRMVCKNGQLELRYNPAENLGLKFSQMAPLTCQWINKPN